MISLVRFLSSKGLENAFRLLAINGRRHAAPKFSCSEILEKRSLGDGGDFGAVRLRMIALKKEPGGSFAEASTNGSYENYVVPDLAYWLMMPRQAS